MKPAAERKAELEQRLTQAARSGGSVADIASAIVDAIDASLRERNRPGKRDRLQADAEEGTTS
jgi:hypothetical protein